MITQTSTLCFAGLGALEVNVHSSKITKSSSRLLSRVEDFAKIMAHFRVFGIFDRFSSGLDVICLVVL